MGECIPDPESSSLCSPECQSAPDYDHRFSAVDLTCDPSQAGSRPVMLLLEELWADESQNAASCAPLTCSSRISHCGGKQAQDTCPEAHRSVPRCTSRGRCCDRAFMAHRSLQRGVSASASNPLLDDQAAVACFVVGRRSSFCREAGKLAKERAAGKSARRHSCS